PRHRTLQHLVVPAGGPNWYDFAVEYLSDGYTVTACADRVVGDVFAAAEQYRPDPSPDTKTVRELAAISQDITVSDGWGTRFDKLKSAAHVPALKGIYADHWLARQLAETDDFLSSTAVLGATLDLEQQRVDTRVQRLRRTR